MQEQKRSRGRPATGRKRNKNLTILVTDDEKEIIKKAQEKENKKSIADLLLYLIQK